MQTLCISFPVHAHNSNQSVRVTVKITEFKHIGTTYTVYW